jgi:hypothetical protein
MREFFESLADLLTVIVWCGVVACCVFGALVLGILAA